MWRSPSEKGIVWGPTSRWFTSGCLCRWGGEGQGAALAIEGASEATGPVEGIGEIELEVLLEGPLLPGGEDGVDHRLDLGRLERRDGHAPNFPVHAEGRDGPRGEAQGLR